jgi:hypothetical protein
VGRRGSNNREVRGWRHRKREGGNWNDGATTAKRDGYDVGWDAGTGKGGLSGDDIS